MTFDPSNLTAAQHASTSDGQDRFQLQRNIPRVGARNPVKISGRMDGSTTASCKTRFTPVMPAISPQLTDGVVIRISDSTAALHDASSAT